MYSPIDGDRLRSAGRGLLLVMIAALSVSGRFQGQDVLDVFQVNSRPFKSHDVIELYIEANFVQLTAHQGLDPDYRDAAMTVMADDGCRARSSSR